MEKSETGSPRGDPEQKEGGKMIKVLIDEEYRKMLTQAFEGARREIRIMMYRIQRKLGRGTTEENLFLETLKERVSKGVRVWLLIDYYPRPGMAYKENLFAALTLVEKGVWARYLSKSRVCHAKAVIIDQEVAIIGSHNWTTNSLHRNLELSVMIKDKEEVKRMIEEFDKLFKSGEKF